MRYLSKSRTSPVIHDIDVALTKLMATSGATDVRTSLLAISAELSLASNYSANHTHARRIIARILMVDELSEETTRHHPIICEASADAPQ